MLEAKNVTKKYGKKIAVADATVLADRGRIHGLVGENGAGKTTLLKCMAGIYRPESGSITYDKEAIYDNEETLQRVAFISDSQEFFSIYSVRGLLKLYQKCYPDFQMDQFMKLNQKFGVDLKKGIGSLSKGQKMRLSFMLAIARRPAYILMDEPTDGLDVGSRSYLKDVLIEETEKRELCVILSSHDLNGLEMLCDEVSFMKQGRIQRHSDMDDVIESVQKWQVEIGQDELERVRKQIGLYAIKQMGRLVTFQTMGNAAETEQMLRQMGVQSLARQKISFEEVFLTWNENVDTINAPGI